MGLKDSGPEAVLEGANRRKAFGVVCGLGIKTSMSRKETDYLEMDEDIGSLAGSVDRALAYSEVFVEEYTYWLDRLAGRV